MMRSHKRQGWGRRDLLGPISRLPPAAWGRAQGLRGGAAFLWAPTHLCGPFPQGEPEDRPGEKAGSPGGVPPLGRLALPWLSGAS